MPVCKKTKGLLIFNDDISNVISCIYVCILRPCVNHIEDLLIVLKDFANNHEMEFPTK